VNCLHFYANESTITFLLGMKHTLFVRIFLSVTKPSFPTLQITPYAMVRLFALIALSLCLSGCFLRPDITKEYVIDASKPYTVIYSFQRSKSHFRVTVDGHIKGKCRILTGFGGNNGGYDLISDCNYILRDNERMYSDSVKFSYNPSMSTMKGYSHFLIYYPENVESGDSIRIRILESGFQWY